MIAPLSRYRVVSEARNNKTEIVALKDRQGVPNYRTYQVSDGESFQSIATQFFGSPLLYWRIADINPHVPYPDYIPSGTIIRIPA